MEVTTTEASRSTYRKVGVTLLLVLLLAGCGQEVSQKQAENPAASNPAAAPSRPAQASPPDVRGESGNNIPSPKLSPDSGGSSTPASEAKVTYSIEELKNEYRMSRVGTDTKLDGKVLEITGTVLSASKNLEGSPFVRLGAADDRFVMNCVLSSDADLANLVEGENCRLRGVYRVSILPTFVQCLVVQPNQSPATHAEDPKSNQPKPDLIMTAEQLEAEVNEDAQLVSRKYTGKLMQVTGRLSRISHVAAGAMVYRMGPPLSTQYFIRTGDPWYNARPGQEVTLVGKWFPGYPCLVNCEATSITGKPDPIHTAVSLGESLEADRGEFRKSYYLKQLIVTGEVVEKRPPQSIGSRPGIVLRSTAKTNLVCDMEPDEVWGFESVQIGDTITIAGWNTKETPTDSILLVQGLFWRGK